MIKQTVRLAVLGLVIGLASSQMASAQCSGGGCGDDDSKSKGSSTNKVTPAAPAK